MGIYTDRKNYFKTLAQADPNIKHGANDVIDGQNIVRNSFIGQAIDKDSISANYMNGMHFPAAVFSDFKIGFVSRDVLMERKSAAIRILGKINVSNPADVREDLIEDTKDETLQIAKMWVNKLYNDINENPCAGIRGIDTTSIMINELPAQLDGTVYGWEIMFSDQQVAKDIIQYNTEYWQ